MGDCIITRRGGSLTFAFILVTYPAGSVCTCTDGTRTLRAKGTTGSFVFNIPYAATWTVSCTSGTETATASVSITTKGQSVSVALSYRIPSIYQEVQYLQSNGNQFIDTGIVPNTNTKSDVIIVPDGSVHANCVPFGSETTWESNMYGLWLTSQAEYMGIFANEAGVFNGSNNANISRITIINKVITAYEGNTQYSKSFSGTFTGTKSIYLFRLGRVDGQAEGNAQIRIGSAQFWQNGSTLTADLIPVYRKSDNIAGMWDAVRRTFYTNAGSGSFTVGPDVN